MHTYITRGVCSKKILFDVEDNRIKKIEFQAGCDGNLQGISKLVVGMRVDEVVIKLKGIRCGDRETSCPDQLAIALENAFLK